MDITHLKVVYICPDHNSKYNSRKEHMETLLKGLGFKTIIHFKSESENYPKCLINATIDILTTYMNEPVLILEDDIEFTGVRKIDIPENTDAIYLGLSIYGGHKTENMHEGSSKFAPYSENQVRVLNMLTTHAILYISPAYKQAVINILSSIKDNTNYYNDVLISRIQSKFIILANKKPSFYQSHKFNNGNACVEEATNIYFKEATNVYFKEKMYTL